MVVLGSSWRPVCIWTPLLLLRPMLQQQIHVSCLSKDCMDLIGITLYWPEKAAHPRLWCMRHIFVISVFHSDIQYRQFGLRSGLMGLPWGGFPWNSLAFQTSAQLHAKTQIPLIDWCPGGLWKGTVTGCSEPVAKHSPLSVHGRPVVQLSSFYSSSWEPPMDIYVSNHWPFRWDSDSWPQSSAALPFNSF